MKNTLIFLSVIVIIGLVAFFNYKPKPLGLNVPKDMKQSSDSTAQYNTYTLEGIAAHNSASSCFVAVEGKVYDVTSYIKKHKGGEQAILDICGTDGTQAFKYQHGNEPQPNNILKSFYIGDLQTN